MTSEKEKPDSSKKEGKALDPRLASFLRRASPIISSERGLNATSRLKLESLAKDIKLPDELFERGLKMLQDAPSKITSAKSRWERAFEKRLKLQLKNVKGGILTASMENRAVKIAKEKYQLEELQAREVIQKVAQDAGIGRISVSEAERHIEDLVRDKVGLTAWMDPTNRELIHDTGRKWGLSAERVETIIAHFVGENRRRHMRRKRTSRIVTIIVTLVVFIGLGGVVAFMLSQSTIDDPDDVAGNSTDDTQAQDALGDVDFPQWWREEAQLDAIKARLNVTGFDSVLDQMAKPDPTNRSRGYVDLVSLYRSSFAHSESRQRLASVIIHILEMEPSDTAANSLIDAALGAAEAPLDDLPDDRLFYDISLAVVTLLARSSVNDSITDARREYIREGLIRATGVSAINAHSADAVADRFLGGQSEVCFRALISAAATKPKQGLTRHQWLMPAIEDYLTPTRIVELNSQYVLATMPFDLENWTLFRDILDKCIVRDNPLLYRFISLAETTPDADLQEYLFRRISGLLDVAYSPTSTEEMASALRRKLGVVPGTGTDETALRWSRIRRRLESLPDIQEVAGSRQPPHAEDLILITYYANLACAMAQFPPRSGQFDRLIATGQPVLEDVGDGDDPPNNPSVIVRTPSRRDRERFDRFMDRIKTPDDLTPIASKVQALKGLESIADQFDDIERDDAELLAAYILANKESDDHLEALTALPGLSAWNELLLAVADSIEQSPLSDLQVEQIAFNLSGVRLRLSGAIEPRRLLRIQLIDTVVNRISNDDPLAIGRDVNFDRLQRAYLDQIRLRADLLTSDEGSTLLDTPSNAMREVARRLDLTLRYQPGHDPETLDREFASIEFMTESDLTRVVLLQRIVVERTADVVLLEAPRKRSEVEQLLSEFQSLDDSTTHLATQLYLGEWYQLQLWMRLQP